MAIANKARYLLSEGRDRPQTCRWVSSRVELIKGTSNSTFTKKIPYEGFSKIRSHILQAAPLIFTLVIVQDIVLVCFRTHNTNISHYHRVMNYQVKSSLKMVSNILMSALYRAIPSMPQLMFITYEVARFTVFIVRGHTDRVVIITY